MKNVFLQVLILIFCHNILLASADYTATNAAKINLQTTNGVHNYLSIDNFNNTSQGTKSIGSYFHVKAAEGWIFKNNGSDVTGGNFHYRIYKSASSPGAFNSISFTFHEENGSGTVFQRWGNYAIDVDVLATVNSPGTWVFECYWSSPTNGVNCANPIFLNAGGSNYSFTFIADVSFPVELSSFSLEPKNTNEIFLNWQTASELNNSHFQIQRSPDSRTWETIGQVQGHGTNHEPQEYNFTDDKPLSGMNYYRLQQVDFDGNFEYSKILSVEFGKGGETTLSPNPAGDELFIKMAEEIDGALTAIIFDTNGALQFKRLFNYGNPLNISDLPSGIYFLKIENEIGGIILQERFIKK